MKLELHAHTAEVSPCGSVPSAELMAYYKEKDFSGVVITDHYRKEFFTRETDEENVRAFLSGFYAAKEAGEKLGITVYCGMELRLNENPYNEYLAYGIDEAFLFQNPRIFELPLAEVHKIVADYGAALIQAHPYRNGDCMPRSLGKVDGYEVFNGHFCHINYNPQALALAQQRGALMTAGADTHAIYDVGNAGVFAEKLPKQRKLGDFIKGQPKLITTTPQHFKAAVLTTDAPEALEKAAELSDIDAVFTYGRKSPAVSCPVIAAGDTCSRFFADRRYTALSNQQTADRFNPSVCLCETEKSAHFGSSNLIPGKAFEITRSGTQFAISVPENSLTVLEFFGFRPKLVSSEVYDG